MTDNGEPYDFSTPISGDVTLYAVWEGEKVDIIIAVWMEKPNIVGTPTHANGDKSQKKLELLLN